MKGRKNRRDKRRADIRQKAEAPLWKKLSEAREEYSRMNEVQYSLYWMNFDEHEFAHSKHFKGRFQG